MHGSIRTSSCLECGRVEPLEGVLELLRDAPAPACRNCGRILKPDVVMFGELLPPEAIDRAFELAREAALLVVVGSSLEVHPVAGLPGETLAAGGRLAILNRGRDALRHAGRGGGRRVGGRGALGGGRGARVSEVPGETKAGHGLGRGGAPRRPHRRPASPPAR